MITLRDFLAAAAQLEADGLALISGASSASALEEVRTALTGRKSGRLTELMKGLPSLAPEERREAGAALNRTKVALEEALAAREARRWPPTERRLRRGSI